MAEQKIGGNQEDPETEGGETPAVRWRSGNWVNGFLGGDELVKEKKRYLLVQVDCEGKLDERQAKHALYEAVFSLLGEGGAADAGVKLIEWNMERQEAMVLCKNTALEEVVAALALKRFFEGKGIALRVKRVSGTIKALKK